MRPYLIAGLTLAMIAALLFAGTTPAYGGGAFIDDDTSVHEADIDAIAALGITKGCNPPVNDRFCPDDPVTRGQMAAFLTRALGLTDRGTKDFIDDDTSIFEADIEKLATAGITRGCNPPVNDRFCPDDPVTRGQMAAFLVRALGLTDRGTKDFIDDDTSIFEADIEKLATAGITRGCNPPANTMFCPTLALTRAQMATFLIRSLEIIGRRMVAVADQAVVEGGSLSVPVTVTTPEVVSDPADAFVLSVSGLPGFGAFTDNGDGTGEIGLTPGFADAGSYPMTVTATRRGKADSTSFTLTVTNVNRMPTITDPGTQTSGEGSSVFLALQASDPDVGDVLTFSVTGLPSALTFDPATGEISGTVSATAKDDGPDYLVTASVSDGTVSSAPVMFTWTVNDTNRNPTLGEISDQSNFAADTGISLDLSSLGSDPDPGDTITFSAVGLPTGLTISAGGVITGDISSDAGGVFAVTVTVTDDGTPTLSADRSFQWQVWAPEAVFTATQTGGVFATTRTPESLVLTNSSKGGITIDSISIDLSTSVYPDIVWDPEGTAGDPGFGCLTANAVDAAAVGFTPGPGSPPCNAEFFTVPHEGGWDVVTMTFGHFEEGESFRFSAEADPTSISSLGGAGFLSAMEMTGATVTVTFSTGAIVTELFQTPGTFGGAQTIARRGIPTATPSLDVITHGGGLSPVAWDATHAPGGTVKAGTTTTTSHTVRVSGPEGATVRLLVLRSDLVLVGGDPGFDVDPFEANNTEDVDAFEGVISGGSVDFAVSLLGKTKLFYMIATIRDVDGDAGTLDPTGPTSNIVILRQDGGNTLPVVDPLPARTDPEGAVISLQPVGSDADPGQTLTWRIVVNPTHDPLPAGLSIDPATGLISGTISAGAAGDYFIRVEATDNHPTEPASDFADFGWTVTGP